MMRVEFDSATVVKVAEYFESTGMATAAARMWQGVSSSAPYDREAREKLGELLFEQVPSEYPLGSAARSRQILDLISQSLPTAKLTEAYFENLKLLLASRPKRTRPGEVILGVGAGRCGSTTLCAAVASVPDACVAREIPPWIYWEPLDDQVRFHIDRLRLLADYYPVVFEAARWWLNALDQFFNAFPKGKVIALHRNTESCVRSFLNVKVRGRGPLNHWSPPEGKCWAPNSWDPTYPSYSVNANLAPDPDEAKAAVIERYVKEYNQTLRRLTECDPRVLLIRTEDLNSPATTAHLSSLLGQSVTMPHTELNAGSTRDSDKRFHAF